MLTPHPDLDALIEEVGNGGVLVLTGAGISTDSGIPDYRGPNARPRSPMTFAEYARSPRNRQRYWARSYVGFARFGQAEPNDGHRALAALQRCGYVAEIITQNVDGLHQRAGAQDVTELHGRIGEVICLDCRQITARRALQERLEAANPGFVESAGVTIAPDGDADVEHTDGFVVVPCRRCGGVLKPHVVMFGENVARPIVDHCYRLVDRAEMLLVVGSSLQVQSGLRFVRHAAGDKPIAIVNRGRTRGDEYADQRLDAGASEVLCALVDALEVPAQAP